MKTIAFYFLALLFSFSHAEVPCVSYDDPHIPDDQWRVYADAGVWVSLAFITKKQSHEPFDKITLYLKNISTIDKRFYFLIAFFYEDENKVKHFLRPPVSSITSLGLLGLKPGGFGSYDVSLFRPGESTFIISHLIQANFTIEDTETHKSYEITTSPKRIYLPQ